MHPVRQLQLRLPAQRDPLPPVRASQLDGAPDGFRSAALNAPGLPETRYTLQVYVEDCTGLRAVRRGLSGLGAWRAGAQGDQPRRDRAADGGGAGEHRVLRAAAGGRPLAGGLRHRTRHAVPGAAVRVLRRVRRVRRDAVPEARFAAVRRPADDRQRDRLLVDLRREPAHDALDGRCRRARSGVVELAVRGQRRVRARPAARRRHATPSWPAGASTELRDEVGAELVDRDPRRRRSCASPSCARSASGSASCSGGSTGCDEAARRRPAQRPRPPAPAQRVDRRRRRLGVRHRVRRPRSRAGQRPQRQRARARHRDVLQYGRADVEGDAARRGGEVRLRRQDDADQGPRAAGDLLRQRVRRPGRDGRRSPADPERASARPRPTTGRRC